MYLRSDTLLARGQRFSPKKPRLQISNEHKIYKPFQISLCLQNVSKDKVTHGLLAHPLINKKLSRGLTRDSLTPLGVCGEHDTWEHQTFQYTKVSISEPQTMRKLADSKLRKRILIQRGGFIGPTARLVAEVIRGLTSLFSGENCSKTTEHARKMVLIPQNMM